MRAPTVWRAAFSEYHGLSLTQRNDLWYLGGGVFQPWSFGYIGRATGGAKSLANLYDASVDVKLNSAVSLNLYYGRAQGQGECKQREAVVGHGLG